MLGKVVLVASPGKERERERDIYIYIINELQVISINNSQLLLWERRWPEGYYVFILAWIHLALQMLI